MVTNRFVRQGALASCLTVLALALALLSLDGAGISAQTSPTTGEVATVQERKLSPTYVWVARKPEQLHRLFARAVNEGNMEAVVALFEADGQLAAQPGQPPVQGHAAIRTVVEGWMALQLHFQSIDREVIPAGDLALLRGPFQVTLVGPDGQTRTQSGNGLEIARRQPDGSWRYVLGVGAD
jgi:ketosteroid isomerase-like protein